MITPKITGAIITALVIVFGVALLYPALRLNLDRTNDKVESDDPSVLLAFNIVNSSNLPAWCHDLSGFLRDNYIHSTIFMTGIIAKAYPTCVSSFSEDTDIGSMSYSYDNVTSISSYPAQLSHIKEGKVAIDEAGKLNSTLFRAPYGNVDQNIYSLLSRSQILADFSYGDHYNIYTNGLSGKTFYTFPIRTLTNLSEIQNSTTNTTIPLMFNFYNFDSIRNIKDIINSTSKYQHQFVSPSDLTRMDLTIR
jgi:Polysaccharide deacetylase